MAAKDLLTFAFVLIFVSCCVHGFPNSGINECNIMFKNKVRFQVTHIRKRPVVMLRASIPCNLRNWSHIKLVLLF